MTRDTRVASCVAVLWILMALDGLQSPHRQLCTDVQITISTSKIFQYMNMIMFMYVIMFHGTRNKINLMHLHNILPPYVFY